MMTKTHLNAGLNGQGFLDKLKPMRFFLIFICALMMAASPAMATDLFIKKNKDNALPDVAPTQQQTQPAPAPALETAPAQTPQPAQETMESFAQRYNENCLKKQDPVLKGEPQRMLCACSASKLQEAMTVDEVKAMMTDTPEGLAARNRMVVNVYAPCLEYPARAKYYYDCQQSKDVANHKNALQICTCMADDMAKFVAQYGPAMIAQNLIKNPNHPDPMGELMQSESMRGRAQGSFVACIGRYPVTP